MCPKENLATSTRSNSEAGLVERLVSGLTEALKQSKVTGQRPVKLKQFKGKPVRAGDPTLTEWLEEIDVYCRQCWIPDTEKAQVIVNNLCRTARTEIKCNEGVSSDYEALVKLLRIHFGAGETLQSLQKALWP